MAKFINKATDALYVVLVADLETQLRAVEADEGLTSGDLINPKRYIKARVDHDTMSPLIQVYYVDWEPIDQRNDFWEVGCVVSFSYTAPTVNVEAAELFMSRYLTAIQKTISNNPTLGGVVSNALLGRGSSDGRMNDESSLRFDMYQDVDIQVHDP